MGWKPHDPVLGRISWNGTSWEVCDGIHLESFGGYCDVVIYCPDSPEPGELHRDMYTQLSERQDELRQMVETEMFSMYDRVQQGWRSYLELEEKCDLAEVFTRVPIIENQTDIWKLLTLGGIYICTSPFEPDHDLAITFGCTWDEEHGVDARFKNWEFLKIGQPGA